MSVGIDPVKRFQVGLERIRGNPNPTATKLPITEVTLNPNENYFTPYGMNRRYASKNFGRTVYLELPNCPHRCWWCYVDPRNRVKAPEYQIQRKKAAGFENCKPSVFEEALKRVFERRGTPIIEYTKKQYSTSHPQYIEVMRQVIDDKAGTRKSQQLTTIEGLDL